MNEYLDICQRTLRSYLGRCSGFNADHAIVMLECIYTCRTHAHHPQSELIGFHCASLCVDCLDPQVSKEMVEIKQLKINELLESSIHERRFEQ
jgi:hypothetical protein